MEGITDRIGPNRMTTSGVMMVMVSSVIATTGAGITATVAIELAPVESQDYPHLYTWLVGSHPGRTIGRGGSGAYRAEEYVGRGLDLDIGRFLLNQVSEADFLGAATSSNLEKDRAQHCEAWYYIGMNACWLGIKRPRPLTSTDAWERKARISMNTFWLKRSSNPSRRQIEFRGTKLLFCRRNLSGD